jgi:transcriptional regulator with XRE-family HTH domain
VVQTRRSPKPEDRVAAAIEELTNEEVAGVVNRHASLVSRWRRGSRRPRYEELRDLCLWLGISADWLLCTTQATRRQHPKRPDKLIRVARVRGLELCDRSPDDMAIEDWMPFSPARIRVLIGSLPEDKHRLLMVETSEVTGAPAVILVDRGCDRRLVNLCGCYVVRFRGSFTVSRVKVQERSIICCGRHEPFVIDTAASRHPGHCLIGKVIQVIQENPR